MTDLGVKHFLAPRRYWATGVWSLKNRGFLQFGKNAFGIMASRAGISPRGFLPIEGVYV